MLFGFAFTELLQKSTEEEATLKDVDDAVNQKLVGCVS